MDEVVAPAPSNYGPGGTMCMHSAQLCRKSRRTHWLPADLIFVPLVPGLRGDAPEIKRWRILNNTVEFER